MGTVVIVVMLQYKQTSYRSSIGAVYQLNTPPICSGPITPLSMRRTYEGNLRCGTNWRLALRASTSLDGPTASQWHGAVHTTFLRGSIAH